MIIAYLWCGKSVGAVWQKHRDDAFTPLAQCCKSIIAQRVMEESLKISNLIKVLSYTEIGRHF